MLQALGVKVEEWRGKVQASPLPLNPGCSHWGWKTDHSYERRPRRAAETWSGKSGVSKQRLAEVTQDLFSNNWSPKQCFKCDAITHPQNIYHPKTHRCMPAETYSTQQEGGRFEIQPKTSECWSIYPNGPKKRPPTLKHTPDSRSGVM